jgi:hypothetical protein
MHGSFLIDIGIPGITPSGVTSKALIFYTPVPLINLLDRHLEVAS